MSKLILKNAKTIEKLLLMLGFVKICKKETKRKQYIL